jgi:hypothetical protein
LIAWRSRHYSLISPLYIQVIHTRDHMRTQAYRRDHMRTRARIRTHFGPGRIGSMSLRRLTHQSAGVESSQYSLGQADYPVPQP